MAIKSIRSSTAGQKTTYLDNSGLSKEALPKSLLVKKNRTSGRNAHGHITIRHRGGGSKRYIRKVDFLRTDKLDIPATVKSFHYDPNRTANLALVYYADGEKRLILAPKGVNIGDEIICSEKAKIRNGNRMMLKNVPVGYAIHDVELHAGNGGQLVKSAGASAHLVSLDGEMAQVELPSKEVRYFHKNCYATIGEIANEDHGLIRIGKAGRARRMGKRPEVRGKVMNPVDHPHGGGEGRNPIGLKAPKTPWGAPALGVKTRNKKNPTNRFIIKRRKKKR